MTTLSSVIGYCNQLRPPRPFDEDDGALTRCGEQIRVVTQLSWLPVIVDGKVESGDESDPSWRLECDAGHVHAIGVTEDGDIVALTSLLSLLDSPSIKLAPEPT